MILGKSLLIIFAQKDVKKEKYGAIKIGNARLARIGNLLKTMSAWIFAPKDRVTTGISMTQVSQLAGISTIY